MPDTSTSTPARPQAFDASVLRKARTRAKKNRGWITDAAAATGINRDLIAGYLRGAKAFADNHTKFTAYVNGL